MMDEFVQHWRKTSIAPLKTESRHDANIVVTTGFHNDNLRSH